MFRIENMWKKKSVPSGGVPSAEFLQILPEAEEIWCREAALVRVNGTGALKKEIFARDARDYGEERIEITLNGTPLVEAASPFCPTCAGILKAGYGIETTEHTDILRTGEALNQGFSGIKDAVCHMEPLLGLLETGIYVIADVYAYPTDGNGKFFWDIPEGDEYNPASAASIYTEYFHCETGVPVYLYPTEGADRLDESRVEYYRKRYRKAQKETSEPAPCAVAYAVCGCMSALLDGHHKACAAALEGKRVRCMTILPFDGYVYRPVKENGKNSMEKSKAVFGGISAELSVLPEEVKKELEWAEEERKKRHKSGAGNGSGENRQAPEPFVRRMWEDTYKKSAGFYPTAEEFAEILAEGIKSSREITEKQMEEVLSFCDLQESDAKITAYLAAMITEEDGRLKRFAMKCAEIRDYGIRKLAFQCLLRLKGDEEIEQFFINYLVEEPIAGDVLRDLAYSYFDL